MARFDPVAYRASRAQEYAGTGAPTPAPAPAPTAEPLSGASVFKPFQEAGILTEGKKVKDQQSFVRKVGEDALTLGLVPSALVAEVPHAIAHPIEFAKSTGMGFAEGVVDMFDPEEWKAHPLLNAVNSIANITIVGGLLKSAALSTARTSAINAAKVAAVEAGAEQTIVQAVFKGVRPMKASVFEAAKTGSLEPVISTTRGYLMRAGLPEDVASGIAKKVAEDTVGKYFSENKAKLKTFETMAHPIQAFGKLSLVSRPVQELIFGTPERSAVGKLYGSESVAKDVRGYGALEEWAGMQTAERGMQNTVDNRVRVMEDWVSENPEYAALTPEQRVQHFKEYADADLVRKKFAENHSRDYVLTKVLPEHYVDAMVEFLQTLPKKLTNGQVIEKLTEQYGKDFSMHAEEVRARIAGTLDGKERAGLVSAVGNLANNKVPISTARLTKAEKQLIKELEGSGYRIGRAPKRKRISQASDIKQPVVETAEEAAKTEIALKDELLSHRSTIGRLVDRLGLSPEGVVEGVQFFAFREAFTQAVLKTFGEGKTVVRNGVKYPVESLSFSLERLRKEYMAARSGVLPPIHTIADLRYSDLLKFGFDEKTAKALDKIIRESNVTHPSVTGIGEALSNYVRTRDNPLSRAYNSFLRVQSDLRFKKNPMFGIQAAVESVIFGNMWAKRMPGQQYIARGIQRVTGLKTPIIESMREPSMSEQAMVLENVMGDYNRQLRDAGMSPEIYRGISDMPDTSKVGDVGTIERMRFNAQNADSNIWLGAAGFSNVKVSTNLMRTYARRFGMELDEALAYKMVDGKKVFDHPWMVENMRSAAQSIFGYKTGLLTSPLMRTLNTIFFPIRFQTKTMIQTSQWLGSLSPMSRLFVVTQFAAMADFLTTPEGKQWREKNRPMLASLFNYAFAFEGIGKSVNAATRGQLFGGNTGLIGGLPFGFLFSIARDLGYVKEDESINTKTGKPFGREVIRDAASFAGFVTVVEDILLSMSPAMPFYTATGGAVTFSLNREARTFIEQVMSGVAGAVVPGKDQKDFQRDIRKEKIKVRPGFQKKTPNPLDLIFPGVAEAGVLEDVTKRFNIFDFNKELSYKRGEVPDAPAASTKVIEGVDISAYATDPGHEKKIKAIVESIPQMTDPVEIDEYIKSKAATSSVRGGMVKRAADAYGVSVRLMLAIMQNDSHFGTKGKGARTRNPGNYGNDDTGQMIHFKTWEAGVRAVAAWLADHKASQTVSLSTP